MRITKSWLRRSKPAFLVAALALAGPTAALAAADPKEDAGAEEVQHASYLKLHPNFIVNLAKPPGGAPHMLLATVQVMSRNATTIELAREHMPALRHHMLMLLADQTFGHIRQPDNQRALQESALEMLNGVIQAEIGTAHAFEGVYFTDFIIE